MRRRRKGSDREAFLAEASNVDVRNCGVGRAVSQSIESPLQ
jgi:hypothetical protein